MIFLLKFSDEQIIIRFHYRISICFRDNCVYVSSCGVTSGCGEYICQSMSESRENRMRLKKCKIKPTEEDVGTKISSLR